MDTAPGRIEYGDDFVGFLDDNWGDVNGRLRNHLQTTNEKIARIEGINKDGMIRFVPKGKDGVVLGKPAKLIRRCFTPEAFAESVTNDIGWYAETYQPLRDSDLEHFANSVKAYAMVNHHVEFKVVWGERIRSVYALECEHSQASLGSCMTGHDYYSRLDLYVKNPRNVKMLLATMPDEEAGGEHRTVGRALLWIGDDGNTMLDRPYGSDAVQRMMEKHATDQGWGNRDTCFVTLSDTSFDYFPYLDTMSYYDRSTGRLATSDGFRGNYAYASGRNVAMVECQGCGREIDEEYAYYHDETGETLCESCYEESRRESCNDCGEYVDRSDLDEDGLCYDCREADCTRCHEPFARRDLKVAFDRRLGVYVQACEDCRRILDQDARLTVTFESYGREITATANYRQYVGTGYEYYDSQMRGYVNVPLQESYARTFAVAV
jgi:hypothetical protein